MKKDAGQIYFACKNGENIEVGNYTRGMFTYVPQGKFILSGTIRENLDFVNESATEEEIAQALEVSNCTSFIEKLPDGLETKIGERGSGLSEGQLQRLSLARALISGAPILILDELTSSLDSATEAEVLKNIKNLKNSYNPKITLNFLYVLIRNKLICWDFETIVIISSNIAYTK